MNIHRPAMKTFRSKAGRQDGAIRFLLSILLFLSLALPGRSEVLLSCTGLPGGDRYDRGFYIPSFPGNSLDSARLVLSSFDAGDYTVTLTARQTSFNGTVLGNSTVSFSLAARIHKIGIRRLPFLRSGSPRAAACVSSSPCDPVPPEISITRCRTSRAAA